MIRVRFFGSSRRWTVTTSFTIPTVVARASEDATTCQVIRNGTTERKDGGLLHVLHRVLLPKRSQLETTPPLLAGKAAMRSVAGSSARAKSLTEPDALARAEPLAESHALALAGRGWGLLRTLSILGTELLLCRKPTVSPRTPMSSFSAEMDRMGSPRTILTVAAHPTSPFCPPPPPAPPAPPYLCQTGNNFFDNTIGPPVISGGRPANYRCCGAIHVGNCASPPYPWEQLWGGWGPSTGGEGSYGNCNSEHAPKPVPCKSYRGELYNCFNCRIRRDLLPADFDDIRFSSLPVTARRYDSSDRKGAWGQNL